MDSPVLHNWKISSFSNLVQYLVQYSFNVFGALFTILRLLPVYERYRHVLHVTHNAASLETFAHCSHRVPDSFRLFRCVCVCRISTSAPGFMWKISIRKTGKPRRRREKKKDYSNQNGECTLHVI